MIAWETIIFMLNFFRKEEFFEQRQNTTTTKKEGLEMVSKNSYTAKTENLFSKNLPFFFNPLNNLTTTG